MELKSDEYLTIKSPSTGSYKEKGSKFLSFAFPVQTEDEVKQIQQNLRKEYYDARHHCYAFRLGADAGMYRSGDDGEPPNSSGPPIMGQLQSNNLTNILVVVVRYFGGTKLGIPGLIHAYRTATADALSQANIIKKAVRHIYQLDFKYDLMNVVMKLIKEENLEQFDQDFQLSCSLKVFIRQSDEDRITSIMEQIRGLQLKRITIN